MSQFSFDGSQCPNFYELYERPLHKYNELVGKYQTKTLQYSLNPIVIDIKGVPDLDLSWLEPKTKAVVRDYEWVDNLADALEGENNEPMG